MKRINLTNLKEIDFSKFGIKLDELKKRLLIPDTVAIYEDNKYLFVARNVSGRIFFDVVEIVDIKKDLKSVYSGVKWILNKYETNTFYMELSKKSKHKKDLFYKNCKKVFENSKKIIYKREVKI